MLSQIERYLLIPLSLASELNACFDNTLRRSFGALQSRPSVD